MTALHELITKWELEMGSYTPNGLIYKVFIEEAKLSLKKERQQIIDAYEIGYDNYPYDGNDYDNGEEYYNQTYVSKS